MNNTSLDIFVAIAQIVSAIITCAGLAFTFYQFNKNLKKDHSKELREYCIDFNEKVLYPLRNIKNEDVYNTCRNLNKNTPIYTLINKLFFDMDAFCGHVKSIYDENDEYLVNEIEKLCGTYIRYVADKIIIFCYCKRRDLNNPYSALGHIDIILKIINKEKNGYIPQEKYNDVLLNPKYKEIKDKCDVIRNNVKVILQSISDLNNHLVNNFTKEYNSNIDYTNTIKSLVKNTNNLIDNYLFPFNEYNNDGSENKYITNIKINILGETNLKIWNERIKILNDFYNNYFVTGKIYEYCKNDSDKDQLNMVSNNLYEILPYDIV